ncbi:MAG TPA: helix-turn-helix transcriptional regulator [Streptosporangiaceae bacterium]
MKSAREHLTDELQRLRELSGRSLKHLETETHASDSSLSRYLSGKTLPPWTVVEGLCRAAGRDAAYLRPIWIAAEKDPSRSWPPPSLVEDGPAPDTAPAAGTPAPPPTAPMAQARTDAPPPGRTGVRWRQGMAFLAIGAFLGVAATQAPKIVNGGGGSAGTTGPHFSVTLLEPARTRGTTAIWSFNARCGNADEYRLVYDLPISVQHRATAYRLDHADCTIKLFDGSGGSGVGEPLANDQRLHPVPPELARRGSSIVAYSCCNGTVIR